MEKHEGVKKFRLYHVLNFNCMKLLFIYFFDSYASCDNVVKWPH